MSRRQIHLWRARGRFGPFPRFFSSLSSTLYSLLSPSLSHSLPPTLRHCSLLPFSAVSSFLLTSLTIGHPIELKTVFQFKLVKTMDSNFMIWLGKSVNWRRPSWESRSLLAQTPWWKSWTETATAAALSTCSSWGEGGLHIPGLLIKVKDPPTL